jgi:hypothetical protein
MLPQPLFRSQLDWYQETRFSSEIKILREHFAAGKRRDHISP